MLFKLFKKIYIREKNSGNAQQTYQDSFKRIRHVWLLEGLPRETIGETRWSTRSGGGIGPYHCDSSYTTRSEGFSCRQQPRGWKWGLKRFRWETQQGVNGSRHAGGAWNVSLEARRKRAGQREGRGSRGDSERTYTHVHTCRVLLCVNGDIRARAHSMSRSPPPHRRYTTTTVIYHESARVFVHESWVYLVLSVRIPRCDVAVPPPFYFCNGAGSRDISCENTRAYWRTLTENRWARDCKQSEPEMTRLRK